MVGYPYLTGVWKGCPLSGKKGLTAGKCLITCHKTISKDKPHQDCCPARRFPQMPGRWDGCILWRNAKSRGLGSRLIEKKEHA
jgi:hypothetical protein